MPGRVLRIVTRLNRGGPLRQLGALVPGLADLGWTGPVLAGRVEPHEDDGSADLAALGAEVARVPSLARGIDPVADSRAAREISRWLRRVRPDVVHTHMAKAGALGRLAARAARVPAVHTFHGHHLGARGAKGRLAALAERALAPFTSAAVALSPRQRDDLVERHRILPADRVHVIGPGIDVERLRRLARPQEVREVRARCGAAGHPLFLWVGRFVPVKDPRLAVAAAARARAPYVLALVGDGPLRERVRAEVEARGLSGRVVLPGPTTESAPWVAACDAVVVSSRSEGTPVAILEAKAFARPAAATSVGGVPDLVEDGRDGLLVAPGDPGALAAALDRLASDEALRRRLGEEAARDVEARFGRERLARETAALYERLR